MRSYITGCILLVFTGSLFAQDELAGDTTIRRELTLEREYSPTLDKATKINSLPEIKEPEATKAVIEFSNYSLPFEFTPQASRMDAMQYFRDLDASGKRGYLNAGVSTFVDVNADLGYEILNTAQNDLSIYAVHRSSSGNVNLKPIDYKEKFKINDNSGNIRYRYSSDMFKFFSGLKYTYSGFNYLTYPDVSSLLSGTGKGDDQTNNIFNINLGVASGESSPLGYLLGVDYAYFSQKNSTLPTIDGPDENFFKLTLDVNKSFGEGNNVGIGGYFRTTSYGNTEAYTSLPYHNYKNFSTLNINPYFKVEGDNWNTKLGFKAFALFNQSKDFYFAPDLEYNLYPNENSLIYVSVTGDVKDNSYNKMFYENRYVLPELRILDSYNAIDGKLGFKGAFSGMFSMDIYLGYLYTQQEHFFMPYQVENGYPVNLSNAMFSDAKAFRLGTQLVYRYGSTFDISLKADFYGWSVDDTDEIPDAKAWNKPQFTSDLTAGYDLEFIPLRITAAYKMELGRKAYLLQEQVSIDMDDVHDIHIGANYRLNETISVFLSADNLFNRKYDIWYGYPAEGFRAMAGVSIKF